MWLWGVGFRRKGPRSSGLGLTAGDRGLILVGLRTGLGFICEEG